MFVDLVIVTFFTATFLIIAVGLGTCYGHYVKENIFIVYIQAVEETNQGLDFTKQHQYKTELKEDDQESDVMGQDYHRTCIKEENQDLAQQSIRSAAGSTDHKVSVDEFTWTNSS